MDRRQALCGLSLATAGLLLGGAGATAASASTAPAGSPFPKGGPRARVLFVNDLSGDVDGLFAAAHALLSPSIELRGMIGTSAGVRSQTAHRSVELAQEVIRLAGGRDLPVFAGAERKLAAADAPVRMPGVQAIIDEAHRTDSALPLYVAVGGGLTEVASALMIDPAIAGKFTLIWIGGQRAPHAGQTDYNYGIDPLAARHVFAETEVAIWQVPREAYATCTVSLSEVQAFVAPQGPLGQWLYAQMLDANTKFAGYRMNTGETWTLGDNPLVLLTALTDWVPSTLGRQPRYERTGSSAFDTIAAPSLQPDGSIGEGGQGRPIRLYTAIDNRMMFNDLFAKLRIFAAR